MGCDIYIHAEVKVRGTWHHYGNYRPTRWYLAFGLMAGVRGDQELFGPPRGLPADATDATRTFYELGCDQGSPHSLSWLLSCEIRELDQRLASMNTVFNSMLSYPIRSDNVFRSGDLGRWIGGSLFHCEWNGQAREPADDVEDWRWVFWFD